MVCTGRNGFIITLDLHNYGGWGRDLRNKLETATWTVEMTISTQISEHKWKLRRKTDIIDSFPCRWLWKVIIFQLCTQEVFTIRKFIGNKVLFVITFLWAGKSTQAWFTSTLKRSVWLLKRSCRLMSTSLPTTFTVPLTPNSSPVRLVSSLELTLTQNTCRHAPLEAFLLYLFCFLPDSPYHCCPLAALLYGVSLCTTSLSVPYIFRCSDVGLIKIYNCCIFLMDWPLYHSIMTLFVSL